MARCGFARVEGCGIEVKATREEDRAQAGACSPLNVQTERVSLCAVVAGEGERWVGSSGGRGEGNPGLSAAHLVVKSLGC